MNYLTKYRTTLWREDEDRPVLICTDYKIESAMLRYQKAISDGYGAKVVEIRTLATTEESLKENGE